jgi:hypothetical protein
MAVHRIFFSQYRVHVTRMARNICKEYSYKVLQFESEIVSGKESGISLIIFLRLCLLLRLFFFFQSGMFRKIEQLSFHNLRNSKHSHENNTEYIVTKF